MYVAGETRSPGLASYQGTALLDALPDATAVLDTGGTILAVNNVWRMFTLDNGGDPASTGPGVNYLQVCERAAAAGCEDAAAVVLALRAVLAGASVESELEYPCPSPSVGRWFVLRVTPIAGEVAGLLVSHANISRQKRAEAELQRQASEDPLTGLANRTRFIARLTAALSTRPGRAVTADVGLLFLDLDGFKPVNDAYGHGVGDEVLQTVGARLTGLVRPQDTVGRLGGDEFAIVAARITAAGLAGLAARVRAVLEVPHTIYGQLVVVGASVGCYLATPGEDAAGCLRRADESMYAVKRERPHRG